MLDRSPFRRPKILDNRSSGWSSQKDCWYGKMEHLPLTGTDHGKYIRAVPIFEPHKQHAATLLGDVLKACEELKGTLLAMRLADSPWHSEIVWVASSKGRRILLDATHTSQENIFHSLYERRLSGSLHNRG